jgi:hypothetical protein
MTQRRAVLLAISTRTGAIHMSGVDSRQIRCNGLPHLSAVIIWTTKIRSRLRDSTLTCGSDSRDDGVCLA